MIFCHKKSIFVIIAVALVFWGFSPAQAAEESLAFSVSNLLQLPMTPLQSASSSSTTIETILKKKATTTATTSPETESDFCAKLEDTLAKLEASYSERHEVISENLNEQNKKIQEERQKYDDQRIWLRLRQDYSLKVYFSRLNKLAETEIQEKAIDDYQKEVTAALEERRRLTDLAVDEYRQDVDNLKSSKMTEMETKLIQYEENLEKEIQKATEKCGSGSGLKAEKSSLSERFIKLRQEREKIFLDVNEAGQAIIAERDRKVNEAEAQYKKTVEKAKENLVEYLKTE